MEQLAASIIRIVTFFQHNLQFLGSPENGERNFLLILAPTHQSACGVIFCEKDLHIAWWSHVRRHNNKRLYELNKILSGLQPRWVTFILLIKSPLSFKTHAMWMLQPLHIMKLDLTKEGIKQCILIL